MITRRQAIKGMLAAGALATGPFVHVRPKWASNDQSPFGHRGAWVDHRTLHSREQIDQAIEDALAMRLNALYPQVWSASEAAFPTDTSRPIDAVSDGFDPLAYFLQRAHEQEIEVHAWVINGSPRYNPLIFEEHPEWRMRDAEGEDVRWFDFFNNDVRQWQAQVMKEIASQYEVDGIHLDYIRYPGDGRLPVTDASRAAARRRNINLDALLDGSLEGEQRERHEQRWHELATRTISMQVHAIHRALRQTGRRVTLSAAVSKWAPGVEARHQDWMGWLQRRFLDRAIPMAYDIDPEALRGHVRWWRGNARYDRVAAGLGNFRFISTWAPDEISDLSAQERADRFAELFEVLREEGTPGYVLFRLETMNDPLREVVKAANRA